MDLYEKLLIGEIAHAVRQASTDESETVQDPSHCRVS